MRTTVTVDDRLLEEAIRLTGISETSALVRASLERVVELEHARRLAALGGSDPGATVPPRSRAA
ncbi:type II toxin-antitoxin system VapB family antitoxin [Leucobacter insecticola]|uniref:Type II toxin-antitoxin system VapB family antitoxin n=1 Tax=Leucobacter insecticola TaxID=2714934 RepID=A0A6G8FIS9_9MICO|nr:type II toxin-antitoxin system VapB family antitoxin [Leucobacter insecticola]QIM16277.1 type II toxin-antitoxin system VapB family antitoxin [Leucobacter insecticola]